MKIEKNGNVFYIDDIGTLNIVKYENVNIDNEREFLMGADIIFKFIPNDGFGENGGTITFVQLVRDDITYISGGETKYTWNLGDNKSFEYRNYNDEGVPVRNKYNFLNYSIDQYIDDENGNKDFRYTEKRMSETVSMSTQDKKVSKLIEFVNSNKIKAADYNLNDFNFKDPKAVNKIKEYLNTDTVIIPEIVYSGRKNAGKWIHGRMSDSPRINLQKKSVDKKSVRGNQRFETLILYSNKGPDKKIVYKALCTLYWGWDVKEDQGAVTVELKCLPGLPEHWEKAKDFWNNEESAPANMKNRIKIPNDVEIL